MEEPPCPATPPLSICPSTPPLAVSPKSSPSQWTDSVNKKTDSSSPSGSRPSSPENCAICLGSLTNKSFTNSCLHQFCFVCLLEWSKVKAECPLCKVVFNSIIHNVRSQDDYDQYHVKQTPRAASIWSSLQFPRSFRYRTTVTYHEFSQWVTQRTFPQISSSVSIHQAIPSRQLPARAFSRPRITAGTSDFRRSIYRNDLWARLQPDLTGRYRECSPEFYRQNPAQLHRLIPFLNRELNVLLDDGSRCAYVMERILELLPELSMTSSEFRVQVGSHIGSQNAAHFCHELRAYASSPYDIVGYDRSVQYYPSAASNFTDEIDEIEVHSIPTPSASNSAHDTDSDTDIQVISPSLEFNDSSSAPHSRSTTATQSSDQLRFSPQPGPSGLSTSSQPTAFSSSVVDVSSGTSSEDEADEVQIVGYVKPRHERTPEIITLSSPEHGSAINNSSISPHNVDAAHDSSDDLICINLGSSSTVSHHLSWGDELDDISSDGEILRSGSLTPTVHSDSKSHNNRGDLCWFTPSTSPSPSRNSSGEEWGCKSRRKIKKSVKRRKVSKSSSKSRLCDSDNSSDSDKEAHSSVSCHKTRKHAKPNHSKSSKSKSKCSAVNERHSSPHGYKKKRSDKHHSSSKSKRNCSDSEANDQAGNFQGKSKRRKDQSHSLSRSKKNSSSSSCHNHISSGRSSQMKSPKLRSIVMTRTTHDGQESWSVSRNQDSPDRSQSHSTQRPSRLHSVVAHTSPTCYNPRSEKFTNLGHRSHRRDSSSSSSSRRQHETKLPKSDWDCDAAHSRIRRQKRSESSADVCSKSSKWKPKNCSEMESDSD